MSYCMFLTFHSLGYSLTLTKKDTQAGLVCIFVSTRYLSEYVDLTNIKGQHISSGY